MKSEKEDPTGLEVVLSLIAIPFATVWAAWVALTVWGMAGMTGLLGLQPLLAHFIGARLLIGLHTGWSKGKNADLTDALIMSFVYPAMVLLVAWLVIR